MGSSTSHENHSYNTQRGMGFLNNFADLQRNIQQMVRKSDGGTATETIGFNTDESDIDLESILEIRQEGGAGNRVKVTPKRNRYSKIAVGGSQNLTGGTGDVFNSSNEIAILKDIISYNNTNTNAIQGGGCGCADDNQVLSPTSVENIVGGNPGVALSATSDQPIDYNVLIGGGDDDEDFDLEDEETDEDIDDDDDDEENEESDDLEKHNRRGALGKPKESSSSSSSSTISSTEPPTENDKKKHKNDKKKHEGRYLSTSQDGGSDDILIDSKYLYSDNNDKFFGSSDNSEYYKDVKHRSIV